MNCWFKKIPMGHCGRIFWFSIHIKIYWIFSLMMLNQSLTLHIYLWALYHWTLCKKSGCFRVQLFIMVIVNIYIRDDSTQFPCKGIEIDYQRYPTIITWYYSLYINNVYHWFLEVFLLNKSILVHVSLM